MSRRRALGVLTAAGAAVAGLAATARSLGNPAPDAVIAAGTTRTTDTYGPLPRQRGEWWVPAEPGKRPTVVLVHGGYWRDSFDLTLEDAVAADLAGRGFLVWNIDYRPSNEPWPATLTDVGAAYDHLSKGVHADRVDPARIAVVGHSAGGHLALWLAAGTRIEGAGSKPTGSKPQLVVPQAPVAALADGSRAGLGGGAVDALIGGSPGEHPDRYAIADPRALLPTGVPSVLLHSEGDNLVPIAQSRSYVAAATAKADDSRLVTVPGDHFAHLDPASAACQALRDALASL